MPKRGCTVAARARRGLSSRFHVSGEQPVHPACERGLAWSDGNLVEPDPLDMGQGEHLQVLTCSYGLGELAVLDLAPEFEIEVSDEIADGLLRALQEGDEGPELFGMEELNWAFRFDECSLCDFPPGPADERESAQLAATAGTAAIGAVVGREENYMVQELFWQLGEAGERVRHGVNRQRLEGVRRLSRAPSLYEPLLAAGAH